MAKVTFPTDLQQYTGGVKDIAVSACNYRDLVVELSRRFPDLTADVIQKYAVAIDGAIIAKPLLETFRNDSELVFFGRIIGG